MHLIFYLHTLVWVDHSFHFQHKKFFHIQTECNLHHIKNNTLRPCSHNYCNCSLKSNQHFHVPILVYYRMLQNVANTNRHDLFDYGLYQKTNYLIDFFSSILSICPKKPPVLKAWQSLSQLSQRNGQIRSHRT